VSPPNSDKVHPTELHFGRQRNHLSYSRALVEGKSIITIDLPLLQSLVEQKAGTGFWENDKKEIIDFGLIIGFHVEQRTGVKTPTTRGAIHYSKDGVHVVPSPPEPPKPRR
jgi:filamentous hemagglutinin